MLQEAPPASLPGLRPGPAPRSGAAVVTWPLRVWLYPAWRTSVLYAARAGAGRDARPPSAPRWQRRPCDNHNRLQTLPTAPAGPQLRNPNLRALMLTHHRCELHPGSGLCRKRSEVGGELADPPLGAHGTQPHKKQTAEPYLCWKVLDDFNQVLAALCKGLVHRVGFQAGLGDRANQSAVSALLESDQKSKRQAGVTHERLASSRPEKRRLCARG